jgi:L-rhamnose-H+ transport protein
MGIVWGFALAIVAGTSMGLNMLPIKWARVWKWENFWLVYTFFSALVVPAVLAFSLCPHLLAVYASLPPHLILRPLLLGLLWGFAQLGSGVCVFRLGFAVTGAFLNGIGTAGGVIVPLMILHPEMLFRSGGLLLVLGTVVALCGVALCGRAGYRREQEAKAQGRGAGFSSNESAMSQAEPTRKGYYLMILVAVISGILAALLNIALASSGEILQRVQAAGAASQWAPFAVWPIALLGGSVVNFIYSAVLLTRNRSWACFAGASREFLNPVFAASMWMGGIALYSSATTYLGALGVSIGFAIFTIVAVLWGQLAAIFTGEWRKMRPEIYRPFALGVFSLVAAVVIFAAANYFTH